MTIYISNNIYISGSQGEDDFNANNPIIGYKSVLTPNDITSTAVTSAGSQPSQQQASNAWTPDTYQLWQGAGYSGSLGYATNYFNLSNSNGYAVDYIAIARHNFGSSRLSYKVQKSPNNIVWTDITTTINPANDDAIMVYFDKTNDRYFRIIVNGTGTEIDAPIIAHVKLGLALVLQRRIYVGHRPAIIKNTKKTTYNSENGQYLGDVIHRRYKKTRLSQENNSPSFFRSNVIPFLNHINGVVNIPNTAPSTFFFAWRPGDYPDEIIYCWCNDNVNPENQGGDKLGGRMSWEMSIEALA